MATATGALFMGKIMNENNRIAHVRKTDGVEQSLKDHLIGTSKFAREFATKIKLPLCGELIGLLHDLGKYSAEFQDYIRFCAQEESMELDFDAEEDLKWKKGKIDHSTAGAQFIKKNLDSEHKAFLYLRQILTTCIASHHSGLIDCISPNGTDKYSKRMEKEDEDTHYVEVLEKCDRTILERVKKILESEEILKEIDSLLVEVKGRPLDVGLITRFLFSSLLDADRTDTADFEYPENRGIRLSAQYPKWDNFISFLERRLAEFRIENNIDELRSEVSLACQRAGTRGRGIFTLTVPTGGGKTLASLRFALEHAQKHTLDRVIYVIPYTSIIDQNAREVQKVFQELSESYGAELVLEHHSNLTPDKETTAQRLMAENWDAPIVYTTTVQLLDSLFKGGTRSARRMHNLANAVIIFDEIQKLPIKVVHLFNNAMNFLTKVCGSSVVLCTATQPLLDHVDEKKGAIHLSPESEIMPKVDSLFKGLKRVEIIDKREGGGLSYEQISKLVKEELEITGSVLTIVNTKNSAEKLYKLCKHFQAKVYYLSTNQCPQHRLELIKKIRELASPGSKEPIICISTQLIEAGVDVDFGSVIRFIAGLDSIAQAAGRCNRSGKRDLAGRVLLVNPIKENINSLEDIKLGKSITERVLHEFFNDPDYFKHSLLSPQSISRFFKYYFYDRHGEMVYPIFSDKSAQTDSLLEILGSNRKAVNVFKRGNKAAPPLVLRQSFFTAGKLFEVIRSQTQGVIVPYKEGETVIADLCAAKDIIKEKKLLRKAQRYSVNCYENILRKLNDAGAVHNIQGSGILCLLPQHYGKDFGLSVEPINENPDDSFIQ